MINIRFKENISVPFNLFFQSITPRKYFKAYINKFSWKFYVYLLKNSLLTKNVSQVNLCQKNELSDLSIWNLKKSFLSNRIINIEDLDFSISTYHYFFDYYKCYSWRAQFYWIANSNFRSPTFFIKAFNPSKIISSRKHLRRLAYYKKRIWFYKYSFLDWNFVRNFSSLCSYLLKYYFNFFLEKLWYFNKISLLSNILKNSKIIAPQFFRQIFLSKRKSRSSNYSSFFYPRFKKPQASRLYNYQFWKILKTSIRSYVKENCIFKNFNLKFLCTTFKTFNLLWKKCHIFSYNMLTKTYISLKLLFDKLRIINIIQNLWHKSLQDTIWDQLQHSAVKKALQKRFKWVAFYYNVKGFFKVKLKIHGWRRRGYYRVKRMGIMQCFKRRRVNEYHSGIHSSILFKFKFRLLSKIKGVLKNSTTTLFLFLQSKFSLYFNFLDFDLITNFNLYLYFVIYVLFKNIKSKIRKRNKLFYWLPSSDFPTVFPQKLFSRLEHKFWWVFGHKPEDYPHSMKFFVSGSGKTLPNVCIKNSKLVIYFSET
jgi:hypothetical protein